MELENAKVEKSIYVKDAECIISLLQGRGWEERNYFIDTLETLNFKFIDDDPCSIFFVLFIFTCSIPHGAELYCLDSFVQKDAFFEECHGINEGNTTFPLSEYVLSLISSLSAEEEKEVLHKINEFCVHYLTGKGTFPDGWWGDSLEKAYGKLTYIMNERAKDVLCEIQELVSNTTYIADLSESLVDWYIHDYAKDDIIAYKRWKRKFELKDWEEALERKMGEYMQNILDSTYLENCKKIYHKPLLCGDENDMLHIGRVRFAYDARELLKTIKDESDSCWEYEEAIGFAILYDYSLTSWDHIRENLAKLIADNVTAYSWDVVMLVIRFVYMMDKVGNDLRTVRETHDEVVYNYRHYIENKYVETPEIFLSKKAMAIWEEATRLGYLIKCSRRYKWNNGKSGTEFALFVYFAHNKLKLSSYADDDVIHWRQFCSFFNVSYDKISTLSNIHTRLKNKSVSQKTISAIQRLFKNPRR